MTTTFHSKPYIKHFPLLRSFIALQTSTKTWWQMKHWKNFIAWNDYPPPSSRTKKLARKSLLIYWCVAIKNGNFFKLENVSMIVKCCLLYPPVMYRLKNHRRKEDLSTLLMKMPNMILESSGKTAWTAFTIPSANAMLIPCKRAPKTNQELHFLTLEPRFLPLFILNWNTVCDWYFIQVYGINPQNTQLNDYYFLFICEYNFF